MAWSGGAVALAGVGLVAAGGGGGTVTGDGLVVAWLVGSALVTVAQARLLVGRDPVVVTAVQFLVAALATLPVAAGVAAAFVNLEPLVGAAAGAVVFGDPVGLAQAAGAAAILTGIALSSLPLLRASVATHRSCLVTSRLGFVPRQRQTMSLPRRLSAVPRREDGSS